MIKLEKVLTLDNVENLTTLNKGYTDRQVSALAASVSDIMEDVSSSIDALESGKSDNGHTHSNYASSVEVTGSGNAITSISQSGNKITATKGSTFLTAHPTISKSTDGTSTGAPAHGGTFTAVDSVTRDSNGHVTKINTKTVTLPAETKLSLGTTSGSGNAVTGISVDGHKITMTKGATFLTAHQDISGKADKSYVDTQDTATLNNAKSYTDTKISDLINSAPTTLDTLGEIATAMEENADVVEALNAAVGTKANASDLTSHTGNTSNPHGVTKAQVGLGNVENKSSATIRGELTKDNVTAALGYTPPTTNTTYSAATASAAGLMPAASILKYQNVSVATTAWASDTTYTDFPYRAAITCSGVTTAHAADVNFELTNAISGNFAPVTLTATNIVYIYAKTKPTSAMTIPYIEARKAVN